MKRKGSALVSALVVYTLAAAACAVEPVASKPTNRTPHGILDTPKAGSSVFKGKTAVYGWALDSDGRVTKVEILLDGTPMRLAKFKHDTPRPDVCKVHPVPACPKVGFTGEVDFSKTKEGSHKLSLRMTDNAGKIVEESGRSITVAKNRPPHGILDFPKAGSIVKGKTPVRGWALDYDGKVTKVEILLDGQPVEIAGFKHDTARPDVCKVQPVPACPKVGFTGQVDLSKAKDGPHTLSLRMTDNGGTTVDESGRSITVASGDSSK